MNRQDQCFLFSDGAGRDGIAFCRDTGDGDDRLRRLVEETLRIHTGGPVTLAYLGPLSYDAMDEEAASMLGGFAKHDPVWFAYLRPEAPS